MFGRRDIVPDDEKEVVASPIVTPIKHGRLQELAERLGILRSRAESSGPNALVSEARSETVQTPRQTVTIEGPSGQGRS